MRSHNPLPPDKAENRSFDRLRVRPRTASEARSNFPLLTGAGCSCELRNLAPPGAASLSEKRTEEEGEWWPGGGGEPVRMRCSEAEQWGGEPVRMRRRRQWLERAKSPPGPGLDE